MRHFLSARNIPYRLGLRFAIFRLLNIIKNLNCLTESEIVKKARFRKRQDSHPQSAFWKKPCPDPKDCAMASVGDPDVFGPPEPDPLFKLRGMDPDPAPDPSVINQR